MNKNTLTVVHGWEAAIELNVTFIPASTDTGRWDMTPEHTPLQIISVENSEGTDVMETASNLFTDHDLAYNSSIELEHLTEIESLGWNGN